MLIDGKKVAQEIVQKAKRESQKLQKDGISVGLAVIMVGENAASKVYVSKKHIACKEAGINSEQYSLPSEASQEEVENLIKNLNSQKNISGILVQLPLPKHIDSKAVCEKIHPLKDVDGFTTYNSGKLFQGDPVLTPCTPAGIMELLKYYNINPEGKNCVVIGRSNIVGKPMAMLMLEKNATVTICHSKTPNLEEICRGCDIIISAVGKPNFLNSKMVKKGCVVIDVGINRNESGKLCGDVAFEEVSPLCSYITPVPGGVGPMTVAMLIQNTVKAAKIQNKFKGEN